MSFCLFYFCVYCLPSFGEIKICIICIAIDLRAESETVRGNSLNHDGKRLSINCLLTIPKLIERATILKEIELITVTFTHSNNETTICRLIIVCPTYYPPHGYYRLAGSGRVGQYFCETLRLEPALPCVI